MTRLLASLRFYFRFLKADLRGLTDLIVPLPSVTPSTKSLFSPYNGSFDVLKSFFGTISIFSNLNILKTWITLITRDGSDEFVTSLVLIQRRV